MTKNGGHSWSFLFVPQLDVHWIPASAGMTSGVLFLFIARMVIFYICDLPDQSIPGQKKAKLEQRPADHGGTFF